MFAAEPETGDECLIPVHEGVFVLARQAEHVGDHSDRELLAEFMHQLHLALLLEAFDQLQRNAVDDRDEGLEAVANKLPGDDVAQPAVLCAVAVLKNVRAKHVLGAELVVAIGLVHRTVVAAVVLERAIDIPIAADDPAIVEAVVIDRVVVAQPFVERKWVPLELRLIEHPRVDGAGKKLFYCAHKMLLKKCCACSGVDGRLQLQTRKTAGQIDHSASGVEAGTLTPATVTRNALVASGGLTLASTSTSASASAGGRWPGCLASRIDVPLTAI